MEIEKYQSVRNYSDYKVSVIIPAYNAESTICTALEAVKKQNLDEIEVIIVDDGSVDNTGFNVLSYMDKNSDMDIIYVSQENAGPGAARNLGLDNASGEFIAFLDADDFAPEGAYRAMYNVAKERDSDVVIGAYMRRVGEQKWYIPDFIKKLCESSEGANLAGDYFVGIKNPSLWNRLYKRKFLEENNIRFLEENHGEDVVFNLDVLKYAKSVYTTDSICYYYSKREDKKDSVSTSWTYKNTASRIRAIKTYALYFDSIGRIYEETVFLKSEITYMMNGLRTVKDRTERNTLYISFMEMLEQYISNKKYEDYISKLLGVELSVAVLLPYDSYILHKQANIQQRTVTAGTTENGVPTQGSKEIVLQQFLAGQIGFIYILKYFKAWIKYKVFR